ncbi:MAG: WYL domain-containing transcriptional regulator [Desulfohalobium sp.]
MPKAAKHEALARQWQMLHLIPTRAPGITARALTERLGEEGFAVSKRTVERDLNELSRQFGLTHGGEPGKGPFGWYFIKGRGGEELGSVELVDAVLLVLMGEALEQMLPPPMVQVVSGKIERARRKLRSLPGHRLAKWSEKVRTVAPSLPFRPPFIRPKVMETVQEALMTDRQLAVRYAALQERPKSLTLNPLGLVLRGPVLYLLASVEPYRDVLHFALHRMERARLTDNAVTVPEGFDIDAHIESGGLHFGSGKPMKLRAVLSESLASYLSETPLSADQAIAYRRGKWVLTATVPDTWQLEFWILSQANGIEVTAPKRYRQRIQSALAKALGQYQ